MVGWRQRPARRRAASPARGVVAQGDGACAARVPELNGFWVDGAPKLSAAIHLGWAISLRDGGLIAPAIRDADKLTIDQAMSALRDR